MMASGTQYTLLRDLNAVGVELQVNDGKLRYRPASKVGADLKERIRRHKDELIAAINHGNETTVPATDMYSVKELAILKQAGLGPADVPIITALKTLFGSNTPVRVTAIQPANNTNPNCDGDKTPSAQR